MFEVQGDKVTTARNIREVDEALDVEARRCDPSFSIIATIACPGGFEGWAPTGSSIPFPGKRRPAYAGSFDPGLNCKVRK